MSKKLTITATIKSPVLHVWNQFNDPQAIKQWNHASPDWYCPASENDLRAGGRFKHTMASRDDAIRFDFSGVYREINHEKWLAYTLDDGRKVTVSFSEKDDTSTRITTTFETETEHTEAEQQQGWQAILDNFKGFMETCGHYTATRNFIETFNYAFASNDSDYILNHVTDDISWIPAGSERVNGRAAFEKSVEGMKCDQPLTMSIDHILVDGNKGAAAGSIQVPDGNGLILWAFSDIYEFAPNGKIRVMASCATRLNP